MLGFSHYEVTLEKPTADTYRLNVVWLSVYAMRAVGERLTPKIRKAYNHIRVQIRRKSRPNQSLGALNVWAFCRPVSCLLDFSLF